MSIQQDQPIKVSDLKHRLLLSGIDSLYVSYAFDPTTSLIDWDALAFRKEQLRTNRSSSKNEIELGSEMFWLMPYGKHPYTYVLSNKGYELRLSERMHPCCHVQFFSEALWDEGPNNLLERIGAWARSLGLTETRDQVVSRVDWAFDFSVPAIDFEPEHFVSRARKNARWAEDGKLQTIQFGTGDIVVRVYNKVAEIEQASDKAFFFDLWGQKENVWRVEFQVRRGAMKPFGIKTPADLQDFQWDILHHLAHDHTTLREPSGDGNRSRWPLHPLWVALQHEIAHRERTGLMGSIDPKTSVEWRIHGQKKSLYGNLKGIAALLSIRDERQSPMSFDELIGSLKPELNDNHNPEIWEADIQDRMTRFNYGQW